MTRATQSELPILAPDGQNLPAAPTPYRLLELASQAGAGVETMKELMALQERWEANEARKAYHAAMAAFKSNPPHIGKNKLVRFGSGERATSYAHATLAHVTDLIGAELSKHGLSAAWRTEQQDGRVSVTCTITHRDGHSESTTLSGAPDNSGSKNAIQQIGSTVTYLQRYTLLSLTGLATHDQDDDGAACGARGAAISPDVASHYFRELETLQIDERKFLDYLGVQVVEDITTDQVPKVEAVLAQKRRQLKKELDKEATR